MSAKLEVTVEEHRTAVVIHLRGQAGVQEASLLEEQLMQLLERPSRLVIIDLDQLDYLSGTALQALADFRRWLLRRQGRVILAGGSPWLRALLTEIGGPFPKVIDVETALARAGRVS